MAQQNDLRQILEIQSRERIARAEKRVQAQKEAEKNKRKRPGKPTRAAGRRNLTDTAFVRRQRESRAF